ncbi:hypothetical protein [Sphingobacterium bovistauri]|uniref:Uncharacterized protein n=1 Tax=Sphingobacterium bovistauri TaxID=2781959 RepID=A0ABS7Z5H3_9SPHI|nr:hypothetical protein [Sphingobacterium bovistauri]MCA5004797.1 hypothetical protein [Sphingobacterium bovistauri]
MHHVEYENSYIVLLKEEEILNPFAVLKETFQEFSTATQIQNELYEIMTLAVRKNYWMTYESPLILYKKYKKLIRLIEAGWLIEKIRPDLDLLKKLSKPYKEIQVNTSKDSNQRQYDSLTNAYQTLISVYNSEPLFLLKNDLYNLLFEGLMPTAVHYTYEFEGYMARAVEQINELIISLHNIYNYEKDKILSDLDIEILSKERDEFIKRDTVYNYNGGYYDLYSYSIKEDVINAVAISKEILFTKNFWKFHGNPGNILHYYHDFLFILDCYSTHYKYILRKGIDINTKWKYPKEKREELFSKGYKWIKRPWKYLHNQFQKKSIYEWREFLELCLEDVLSNQQIGYRVDFDHNEMLDFIVALLFLQEISDYEPEI